MTLSQLGALLVILTVGCGYWQNAPVGMDTAPQVWAATSSARNGEKTSTCETGTSKHRFGHRSLDRGAPSESAGPTQGRAHPRSGVSGATTEVARPGALTNTCALGLAHGDSCDPRLAYDEPLALDHHVASVNQELREFCVEPRGPKDIHRHCDPRITQPEVLHQALRGKVCRARVHLARLPAGSGA